MLIKKKKTCITLVILDRLENLPEIKRIISK